ncbi:MAG TPA: electron transfer flavoprotein subunit beta, partial [bacterium]|nr:electron transfer flavoprotein subunit beta [bacterium]
GLEVLERVEGGQHQVTLLQGAPAVFGWATGSLPEPPNNPQVGMANMRTLMPALQKAKATVLEANSLSFAEVAVPSQKRETRVVKDLPVEQIAQELAAWIKAS